MYAYQYNPSDYNVDSIKKSARDIVGHPFFNGRMGKHKLFPMVPRPGMKEKDGFSVRIKKYNEKKKKKDHL